MHLYFSALSFFLLTLDRAWLRHLQLVQTTLLLTCKWIATSMLSPELLSFMLTHGCNLFIQAIFKWFSAATKLFLWHQSDRNCNVSLQRGVQFISSILLYLSVCSWHCAGHVLASTSRLLPLLRLTRPLTRKQLSVNIHVYNFISAQALVFSCCVTDHKDSGSPRHWIGFPSRMELLKMSVQRLIWPPSSVPWSNMCAPLSHPSIRFQKETSYTHFQIVLSCFFMTKNRRRSCTYDYLVGLGIALLSQYPLNPRSLQITAPNAK